MITSRNSWIVAGTLVVTACLLTRPAAAQSIASRVSSVRDGKVRMSFASRDDICGWGDGITTNRSHSNNTSSRSSWRRNSEDVEYDQECSAGPVRVVLTRRGGRLDEIRTYVGGRWRAQSDVTDLGTVSTKDAVDYLIGVANTESGDAAGKAIFPTTIADSVDVAPRLAAIAENESRNDDVRGQAVFWLGQTRSGRSGDYLRSLYKRIGDEDVKDKVIFAISQDGDENSQNWLIDLATNTSEPLEMRKKALFWAGQSHTPIQRLTSMYDRMRDTEMKEQMIFVLSQRREGPALDKLMQIAKNDPERDLRKKAMFWLGQSHDPRVAAFLSDIITR